MSRRRFGSGGDSSSSGFYKNGLIDLKDGLDLSSTGHPPRYHRVAATSFDPLIGPTAFPDAHMDSTGNLNQQRQQEDQRHPQIPKLERQSIGFDSPQQQAPSGDRASQETTQRGHRHC